MFDRFCSFRIRVRTIRRRTGNYKPFGVFTAMLQVLQEVLAVNIPCRFFFAALDTETGCVNRFAGATKYSRRVAVVQAALAGTNPAVKIDLLTYADLETLRQRKLESNSGRGLGQNPGSSSGQNHAKLKNKRYLIMTFTSEFDRVHYPLPLEYQGEPRAGRLQGIIRTLTQDLSEALEGQRRTAAALVELQRTHEHVCGERNALQRDVASLQQTLTTTHAGGGRTVAYRVGVNA